MIYTPAFLRLKFEIMHPGHKERERMETYICGIHPRGNAFLAGCLQPGDQLLKVYCSITISGFSFLLPVCLSAGKKFHLLHTLKASTFALSKDSDSQLSSALFPFYSFHFSFYSYIHQFTNFEYFKKDTL